MSAISVVITTYNLENDIENCLREIMEQTWQDFSVLIVDDYSTDATVEILKKWETLYPEKISLILLGKNLGMPALVRNVALNSGKIRGEYVIFFDGDDTIEKNMLEKMYEKAVGNIFDRKKDTADAVICAYDRIDCKKHKVLSTEMKGFPSVVYLPPENDILAFINTSSWNKLWKREVIEDLRYSPFKVGEEVLFNFYGYKSSKKIEFLDEILIHYHVHSDSVISNTDEETIWQFADALAIAFKNMEDGIYRDTLGMMIFLHIGLSMSLCAANNSEIDIKKHINKTECYFQNNFRWFQNNSFFKLSFLSRRKLKGILIWGALTAYKLKIFRLFLSLYRVLGLHIKF